MYVGESERGVREVFHKARQAAPCIIFFDEIDSLVPKRSSGGSDSHVTERVVSQFLSEMDGVEDLRGVFVLGATNRAELLDPALLRPGRLDRVIELPMPDKQALRAIYEVHTRGKTLARDVDLDVLVKASPGNMTGASVEWVCRRATYRAIQRAIEADRGGKKKEQGKVTVRMEDFQAALAEQANDHWRNTL
jgi:transitional endoplasmic reticulum ATPase